MLSALAHNFNLVYALIYIGCAGLVYLILKRRTTEEELPNEVVDGVFFTMLGAGAIIWILSSIPPVS
jgi:apolipoprotein N-acyltransferase